MLTALADELAALAYMTGTKTVQSSASLLTVNLSHNLIQLTTTASSHSGMDKDANPKPTAKRKANEDSNPLLNAAKRAKKEVSTRSLLVGLC